MENEICRFSKIVAMATKFFISRVTDFMLLSQNAQLLWKFLLSCSTNNVSVVEVKQCSFHTVGHIHLGNSVCFAVTSYLCGLELYHCHPLSRSTFLIFETKPMCRSLRSDDNSFNLNICTEAWNGCIAYSRAAKGNVCFFNNILLCISRPKNAKGPNNAKGQWHLPIRWAVPICEE